MASGKGTGKRKGEEGYGEGEVELDLDDDVLLDEAELTRRLAGVFEAPGYTPPRLPDVAISILELSRRPEASFEEFAGLLEQDAMLAGEVMKLVHSPLYAGQAAIKTIQQALVRLGIKNLRDVVLQAALGMRVFRCDAYRDTMDRLRRHAAACGQLCRIVCRYTALEAEYAFLCGLLHDVGIAATLIALAESSAKKPPDLLAIWPAVERVHARAAQKMTELWGLPADIGLAVGAHHQVKIQGYPHPLAATACVADEVAHGRGLGLATAGGEASLEQACQASHFALDRSGPATLAAAREALGLTDKQMELIARDAERIEAPGE